MRAVGAAIGQVLSLGVGVALAVVATLVLLAAGGAGLCLVIGAKPIGDAIGGLP